MQTTSLRKRQNAGLMTAPVVLSVSVQGLAADAPNAGPPSGDSLTKSLGGPHCPLSQ